MLTVLIEALKKAGHFMEIGQKPTDKVPYLKTIFFPIGLN